MSSQIRHCRDQERPLSNGQQAIIREHYPHEGSKVLKRLPGVALYALRMFARRERLLMTPAAPAARAARCVEGGRTRQGQPRGPIRDGTALLKVDMGNGLVDPSAEQLRNALHGARVALDQSIADAEQAVAVFKAAATPVDDALADCRRFAAKIETIVAALLQEET